MCQKVRTHQIRFKWIAYSRSLPFTLIFPPLPPPRRPSRMYGNKYKLVLQGSVCKLVNKKVSSRNFVNLKGNAMGCFSWSLKGNLEMLKFTQEQIERLELIYPGIKDQILWFENAILPVCSYCTSEDTADVQIGIIGRTINICAATTKFKLINYGPRPGRYFCNTCRRFFDSWPNKIQFSWYLDLASNRMFSLNNYLTTGKICGLFLPG